MYKKRLATLILCFAWQAFAQQPVQTRTYDVWPSPAGNVRIRACLDPGPATSLKAESKFARQIIKLTGNNGGARYASSRGRILIKASDQPRCVNYQVDVAKAADRGEWREAYRGSDFWTAWSGLWLWRNTQGDAGYRIRFHHDQDVGISAPWPLVSRNSTTTVYQLEQTDPDWPNLVGVGRFQPEDISVGERNLRLAILPNGDTTDKQMISQWIRANAEALASVYGRLPLESTQVLVAPIGAGNEPVPWGQVKRGGGAAVHLYINQNESRKDFFEDWTLAHELSHTLHPFMGTSGRWLAEGIASYYQNISRGRTGLLSEKQAWEKLDAGLQRGLKNTKEKSLLESNRDMHKDRAYMRVYWSGAAISLIADTKLRAISNGRQSLDTVLSEFSDCHLPSDRVWHPRDFLAELDRISDTSIFGDLYRRYANSDDFPDVSEAYEQLGLKRNGDRLAFSPALDSQQFRQSLMGRQQYVASRSCSTQKG